MALTVNRVRGPKLVGDLAWCAADITYDSSYAAGGEALVASDFGFDGFDAHMRIIQVVAQPTSGYSFQYDFANGKLKVYTPVATLSGTLDAANLTAVTAADESLTATGTLATDKVIGVVGPAALAAGVEIQSARVASADTVTVRTNNPSAGAINPASGTYTVYLAGANGSQKEVVAATDLSTLTVRVLAWASK